MDELELRRVSLLLLSPLKDWPVLVLVIFSSFPRWESGGAPTTQPPGISSSSSSMSEWPLAYADAPSPPPPPPKLRLPFFPTTLFPAGLLPPLPLPLPLPLALLLPPPRLLSAPAPSATISGTSPVAAAVAYARSLASAHDPSAARRFSPKRKRTATPGVPAAGGAASSSHSASSLLLSDVKPASWFSKWRRVCGRDWGVCVR